MAGVDLPVTPERREIVVTEPIPGLDPRTPFTIDFASTFYFHAEGRGLLMGMSDPDLMPDAVERRTPALGACRHRQRLGRALREHPRPQRA